MKFSDRGFTQTVWAGTIPETDDTFSNPQSQMPKVSAGGGVASGVVLLWTRTPRWACYISPLTAGCSQLVLLKWAAKPSWLGLWEQNRRQDGLIPLGSYFRSFLDFPPPPRDLRGLETPGVCSLHADSVQPPTAPAAADGICSPPPPKENWGSRAADRSCLRSSGDSSPSSSFRLGDPSDRTNGEPRLKPGRHPRRGHAPLVQHVHARVSVRPHHAVRAQGHPQPQGDERERQQLRGPGLLHLRHGRGRRSHTETGLFKTRVLNLYSHLVSLNQNQTHLGSEFGTLS